MGQSGNFTFFTNSGGGGGSGSGDFVTDAFSDISLPATTNTGFSSTALKNPLNGYFADDNSVKLGAKTLWINDLVLIEDETQWINNKPTYEVIFNEYFPGVKAYAAGGIKLLNNPQGLSVSVRNIDDMFGVSGVIRRVAFLLNTSTDTGTADFVVDGVDSGSDATFGGATSFSNQAGINAFLAPYNSSTQDYNIHDYRLTANQNLTLSVAGIVVYFENSGANVDIFPGTTYVNKTKVTTTAGATTSVPSFSGRKGGVSLFYLTSNGVYTTDNLIVPGVSTTASGSATSIDVTTGHGSSFPVGTGVVGVAGTSFYVGTVQSVSTDTLTVSPSLGFTLSSALLYSAWNSSSTATISQTLYIKKAVFDPGQGNVFIDTNGFGINGVGDFYYSDKLKQYRIWGDNLTYAAMDGFYGIGFTGTGGYLQCEGNFSAAEIEFISPPGVTGIVHGTFGINGVAGTWGTNEALNGNTRKTIFTNAGPGWNRFVFSAGSSFGSAVISSINLYQNSYNQGITFGKLAYLPTQVTEATRGAISSTISSLGVYQRVFADEMYLTGAWTRGTTHIYAGGVYYSGTSTNALATVYYYGTNFGFIGTPGASTPITLDGTVVGSSMNVMNSVATLGFHVVTLSNSGLTTTIAAFDYVRPRQEVTSLQNYEAVPQVEEIPQVFEQTNTPTNPKVGDIWFQLPNATQNAIWVYGFGRWNKVSIVTTADDPSTGIMVSSFGYTGTNNTTATNTAEMFNLISWSSAPSSSASAAYYVSGGDSNYKNTHMVIAGLDASNSSLTTTKVFNKYAWTTTGVTPAARSAGALANMLDTFMYYMSGTSNTDSTGGQSTNYKFANGAWASVTALATARSFNCGMQFNGIVSCFAGYNAAGTALQTVETLNSADTLSTGTNTPAASVGMASGKYNVSVGVLFHAASSATANAYTYNGSAYSAAITMTETKNPDTGGQSGAYLSAGQALYNGGKNGASSLNTGSSYNGNAMSTLAASTLSKTGGAGSVS